MTVLKLFHLTLSQSFETALNYFQNKNKLNNKKRRFTTIDHFERYEEKEKKREKK